MNGVNQCAIPAAVLEKLRSPRKSVDAAQPSTALPAQGAYPYNVITPANRNLGASCAK
jgi:hypothetical protein